jgi:hypothetical protein
MNELDKNWLTNGLIDFEYKKYVFLSYLTYVQMQFSDKKLYPVLPQIRGHHRQLSAYKEGKSRMAKQFPRNILGLDMRNHTIVVENVIKDPDMLGEVDEIVDYSLSRLDEQVAIGVELLEYIMDQICIEPIGISPINKNEGYLFFLYHSSREVSIYKYELSPVRGLTDDEQMRTFHISNRRISIANSPEQIKRDLLRNNKDLPNPATYSISSKVEMPYLETLLPVAKKMLVDRLVA